MKTIGILIFSFLTGVLAMAHPQSTTKSKVEFKFLFMMGNDLKQIQHFYQDLLEVTTTGTPEEGWIDLDLGVHVIYFKSDYDIPFIKEWAWQPGYQGAGGNLTSWSMEFSEEDFKKMYQRLKVAKTELLKEKPEWRRDSYWGLTVRDPMGNTMELYTVPANKPNVTDWE